MTKIKYELKGMAKIKNGIIKLRRGFANLMPVWPAIRDEFYRIEKKRFETSNKGRWRPLSPGYAAWKAKHYPGKPIMVRSGDLKKTLTSMTTGTIYNPSKREVTLGTKIKYALAQHFGTKERGGGKEQSRLPPRPLISILKSEANRMRKIMSTYLDTMIGKVK
jgi:phage gpG-like protein